MNNTKVWFSGEFACETTKTDAGQVYWQVSAPGMVTRSGYAGNAKLALREINAAKARMLAKKQTTTGTPAQVFARRKLARRTPGNHNRDKD